MPMPAVHLGKMELYWCDDCNLPILGENECGICTDIPHQVKVTPPGDVRPAFDFDIDLIRETIDRQWGIGYSEHVIPKDKIVLLNGCPALERMDEVIVDGKVIGTLRYDIKKRFEGREPYNFLIRPWRKLPTPEKGYVYMDKGAVKPIMKGASALAVGILNGDTKIKKRDEVLVLDPDGQVICTGSAQRNGDELISSQSGKGVKSRWRAVDHTPRQGGQDREMLLKANEKAIAEMVKKSVAFIRCKVDEFHDLSTVVSYSGGKDSLATLLLVLEAGIEPDMIFIDTGIELPETVENVEKVADIYGLSLKTMPAKSGYWNNVEHFGPSARDYRWCCKTCKLGPVSELIGKEYPHGVLAFIGQRRYESENRMLHGDTWNNPWVPGQTGTSPIQDWTALHVWLFLFSRNAPHNPWYERGFERIGCWVCPASDLSELELLKDKYDGYDRFETILDEYSKKAALPYEWKEFGLWRWITPPDEYKELLDLVETDLPRGQTEIPLKEDMLLDKATTDLLECVFEYSPGKNISKKDVLSMYLRVNHCVGCGVCVARCPRGAICIDNGLKIDREKCVHCGECVGKCPVVEFRDRVLC